MTDTPADLGQLAASTRKSLHWAVFLLGSMLVILAIDLQIKRSIGRQAVNVGQMLGQSAALHYQTERLIAEARKGAASEGQPVDSFADDADHPGGDGGGDVDGSTGVPAGNGQARGKAPAATASRRGRPPKRSPGDG